jgi:AAA+ superfamily predicted ATPase
MVFLGNPGTGKTTVARIVAEILYNLKYIKQNKLIEVSSKDLVGEYVGQTAPKTMAVVEKAMGGLLFIDEAYTLASTGGASGNSYNEEAVATLIQAMENKRDNLVVIFAGYTKEMQDFLDSNSGIVSRIGYTFEFDDYTEDELVKIFEGMMKKAGFTVEEEAYNKLRTIIKENKDMENFGNARFIRNIYEKSIVKHAHNIKDKKSKKILSTITVNDISTENLIMK